MSRPDPNPLSKIHDEEVRQLTEEGSDLSVDVLIELNLAVPMVRVRHDHSGGLRTSFAPVVASDHDEMAFADFGAFLRNLGVGSITPFAMANAYGVQLPARALRAVAGNPLVHGVETNHRRRA